MCLIGFMGMSVFQGLDQAKLQGDVLQNETIGNQEAREIISGIKNNTVPASYAQDPPATSPATPPVDDPDSGGGSGTAKLQQTLTDAANVIANIAVFLLKVIGALLMFMLYWMSDLMDNTFILDGSIGDKLQIIWMFVRNIINVCFAIILVVVAFINVAGYGSGEGNYALKKFLPKMAIALIAINFTFLGARVVLDVNNVLTTAVFALPQSIPDIGEYTAETTQPLKMYAKYRCSFNKQEVEDWKKGDNLDETSSLGGKKDDGLYKQGTPIGSFFDVCVADISGSKGIPGADKDGLVEVGNLKQINTSNFVWVMATRFQGIQNIAKVPLEAKDWESLLMNANFALIFGIIYAVAYLAMFIILLTRVIVLWICIALSPLVALEILFPELMGEFKIGGEGLKATFLNHAFVPLKMAIPMSIGFVMISQMSLVGMGSFSKEILLTGGEFTRDGSLQRILYGIASIALIWMGVFSATEKVQGKQFVEKIKGGVEGLGKFVAKAPLQLIPIVPVAGKAISISALGSMMKTIGVTPEQASREMGTAAGQRLLPGELGRKARESLLADRIIEGGFRHEDVQAFAKTPTDDAGKKSAALRKIIEEAIDKGVAGGLTKSAIEGRTSGELIRDHKDKIKPILVEHYKVDSDVAEEFLGGGEKEEGGKEGSYIATVSAGVITLKDSKNEKYTGADKIEDGLKKDKLTKASAITALTTGETLTHFINNPDKLKEWEGSTIARELAHKIAGELESNKYKKSDSDKAKKMIIQLKTLGSAVEEKDILESN